QEVDLHLERVIDARLVRAAEAQQIQPDGAPVRRQSGERELPDGGARRPGMTAVHQYDGRISASRFDEVRPDPVERLAHSSYLRDNDVPSLERHWSLHLC